MRCRSSSRRVPSASNCQPYSRRNYPANSTGGTTRRTCTRKADSRTTVQRCWRHWVMLCHHRSTVCFRRWILATWHSFCDWQFYIKCFRPTANRYTGRWSSTPFVLTWGRRGLIALECTHTWRKQRTIAYWFWAFGVNLGVGSDSGHSFWQGIESCTGSYNCQDNWPFGTR